MAMKPGPWQSARRKYGNEGSVAKPEWGTKRQCPACGGRFYDLGKADPVVCIKCEHAFEPEVLLKPRRGRPDDKAVEVVKAVVLDDTEEEDLEADLDTVSLEDLEEVEVEDDETAAIADIPGLEVEDDLDIGADGDDDTLLETVDDDDDIIPIPPDDD